MSNEPPRPEIHIPLDKPMEELRRTDHEAFTDEVKAMVREAEDLRLRYMKSRQTRGFVTLALSLISILAGACGFGWYFLIQGDLVRAMACVAASVLPYIVLSHWANAPLKTYKRAHKKIFMPKLAKALGGFHYNAEGGINAKILGLTGILPQYSRYGSEDCFIGLYKGIKVIFAEGRLYSGSKKVFQGLFVLLELPKPVLSGHLIITADKKMAETWAPIRWKRLQPVSITPASNPDWNRFLAFADKPDEAQLVINEKLLKELSEAANIFGRAPLSVAFFKEKYVFIAIPSSEDMFEASKIEIPIPTNSHLQDRRKEVEKLLEVIDVFDIYSAKSVPAT